MLNYFLKEAFPNLTVENMINKKELDESDYYRKSYYNPKLMTTKWY